MPFCFVTTAARLDRFPYVIFLYVYRGGGKCAANHNHDKGAYDQPRGSWSGGTRDQESSPREHSQEGTDRFFSKIGLETNRPRGDKGAPNQQPRSQKEDSGHDGRGAHTKKTENQRDCRGIT